MTDFKNLLNKQDKKLLNSNQDHLLFMTVNFDNIFNDEIKTVEMSKIKTILEKICNKSNTLRIDV